MHRLAAVAVAITLSCCAGLAAADATPAASAGHADAMRAFAHQAGTAPAPAGGRPALVGSYIWSGRADSEYRPFFEWILRLKAGNQRLAGLKGRVTTFDAMHHPLIVGPWQTMSDLDAGATADLTVHLHCTTFAAWQWEVAWNGGTAGWISGDKVNLPMAFDDGDGCAMVTSANCEPGGPTTAAGPVTVTFNLWNVGRKPAGGVFQTIHFRDASGKEVFQAVHHPKPDPLPAGAAQEETEVVKRVPAFTSMDISCDQAAAKALEVGFTGAKDIEVAFIHPDGKKVKAKVRNGLGAPMTGVVVHLAFKDKDGATLGETDISVDNLKPDEVRDISADLALKAPWTDFEVGWSTPDLPAAAATASDAGASPVATDASATAAASDAGAAPADAPATAAASDGAPATAGAAAPGTRKHRPSH
jgi:hypothetical protein